MDKDKIAVVGLDGVPWSLLNRFSNEGIISFISELLDDSFKADLISTDPPWTPPAWTSIASGVNPGKHGIYSFYNVKKTKESFITSLITGKEAKYPRVHEVISLYKRKCLVANLPGTYYTPGYVTRYCIVVSDWLSPSIRVNPPKYDNLAAAFSKYLSIKDLKNPKILSQKLYERVKTIRQAIMETISKTSFDLIFIVFSEIDWIMHKDLDFLHYRDLNLYYPLLNQIDNIVNDLRKEGYKIILVSDHGFKLYSKAFYPMKALQIEGIRAGDIGYSWKKNKIMDKIAGFIKKHPWLRVLAKKIIKKTKKKKASQRGIPYNLVDALFPDPHYMYLSPYIQRKQVKDIFSKYADIVEAYYPHEIYGEKIVGNPPDIILRMKDDVLVSGGSPSRPVMENVEIADHHPIGIFSLEGYPDISHTEIRTWDVAPIIYSLLDLPIPVDTDSNLDLINKLGLKISKDNIKYKWEIAKKLQNIKL